MDFVIAKKKKRTAGENETHTFSSDNVPDEILLEICTNLAFRDLISFRATCRRFNNVGLMSPQSKMDCQLSVHFMELYATYFCCVNGRAIIFKVLYDAKSSFRRAECLTDVQISHCQRDYLREKTHKLTHTNFLSDEEATQSILNFVQDNFNLTAVNIGSNINSKILPVIHYVKKSRNVRWKSVGMNLQSIEDAELMELLYDKGFEETLIHGVDWNVFNHENFPRIPFNIVDNKISADLHVVKEVLKKWQRRELKMSFTYLKLIIEQPAEILTGMENVVPAGHNEYRMYPLEGDDNEYIRMELQENGVLLMYHQLIVV